MSSGNGKDFLGGGDCNRGVTEQLVLLDNLNFLYLRDALVILCIVSSKASFRYRRKNIRKK